MSKKTSGNIAIFIFVVVISGWAGVIVDSLLPGQPKGESPGMGIWLVLPMLTAIAIILFSKISWKEIGFKTNFKGNIKWYISSVFIFPLVTAVILITGAAAKWIDLSELYLKPFILAFCSTLIINFIKNIFEETVWRGYLTSQLVKLNLDDWKIYLIVGSVWGIWHIPYYLVFLPEADIQMVLPVSRLMFALAAVITMIFWSVMYIELFRITRSIWPCVILHMVEDSLINPLVISGYISIASGKEILVSPIIGVFTSILYLAAGLGIRRYRKQTTGLTAG
ncbi:MAG: CPBP family intramembrane glutamic endopeptidase [Spirochaetia bacterium]|jgi:hypothetical protein|nr:CPBP family intramembrane glutamic endopeptidase [Spirochaetia bacterium]